jgi:hypothetical protein
MDIRMKEWGIQQLSFPNDNKNIAWKSFASDGMSGWQYTFVP